jgi:aspartyl protease
LWSDIKRESEKTLRKLNENIMKLRKVSTSTTEVKQIEIQVEAENETLTVIIDCGASVDYVNEAWCEKRGLKTVDIGKGWMEGYDGQLTNVQLKETEIELRFQGTIHRHMFRVIKQTGTDTMVLGMPWLQQTNPDVNWKSRRVTLRKKKAKKSKKRNNPESTAQSKVVREAKEQTEKGRGGYNNVQEEEKYQEQLVETREKLPKELRDYAEVFCHRR